MIARRLRPAVLAASCIALWAWAPARGEEPAAPQPAVPALAPVEVHPWTHLRWNADPRRFQFAIVSDRVGGHRAGVFESAMAKVNLLQPEFVMCVGDLIEGYSEDPSTIRSEWSEIDGFVRTLGMPLFFVPGNHDLTNAVEVQEWQQRFGRLYYHFVYQDVLFLCLDTEDPPSTHISAAQVEYVRQALAQNSGVRWTLVFLHEPLWTYPQDTGWQQVEALLKGRRHTVFAGHFHTYAKYERNGESYYILATTGGASSLQGPVYGQFDHVVWVTMTDRGPCVANLMLDGIRDGDIRTERVAAIVDAVLMGGAVSPEPLFATGTQFRGGSTQVRLANDTDAPMHVQARFAPHAALAVRPDSLAALVAPHSAQQVAVQVQPHRGKAKVEALTSVTLNWHLTFQTEQGQPVDLDGTSQLVVDRKLACPGGKPKQVDGDLSDWKALPFVCRQPAQVRVSPDSWKGADDGSFRFAVEHTDDAVFLAVDVTDEQVVADQQHVPWEQDGVEVRIDARPDPARSQGRGMEGDGSFLLVAASPGTTAADMVLYERAALDSVGVHAVCVRKAGGYVLEMSVPRAYLDGKQGAPWSALRLSVSVDDVDEPNGALAQLCWRPDWRTPENYAASGTFERR